jgi:hypothetical protein
MFGGLDTATQRHSLIVIIEHDLTESTDCASSHLATSLTTKPNLMT